MKQQQSSKDPLAYQVFTSTRPGLNRDPNTPPGLEDLKWVPNSATLIYGKKDAVLVDVFLAIEHTKDLANSIAATGKNLTYIYITHPHGDHFYGLQLLLDRFPDAIAIATPAVARDCAEQVRPEVINGFWAPRFPGQIPEKLAVPQAMDSDEFELEGEKLVVLPTGFSDTHDSTSLYVPSIGLIVAGDVAYNGVHLYLAETTRETRKEWRSSLDMLAGLHPKSVVAGHKQPSLPDDPAILAMTRKYLEDFDRLNDESATNLELYNKMLLLYADRANPGSLWGGALAAKKAS
ncbi:MBL fold metallo-hydrolase [Flavitalea sp. BT771]|uniref:MBL fold metallo-hydrolase n=1 Tax=Flavitalea sp. BT771 TaxID=3063329 RepID=UPI0026E1DBB6|nr:MBL fold metallo-hydrolase [Flavitalea sp. BT771]MDO6432630.1 MBL fold metallo-hydrolase [Flavitalea sp. BT771]MDV6222094.1 MBL fold metallo-hydrolase [Flavitalea sp. BT771]